jgi:phosphohistidine phosphatase
MDKKLYLLRHAKSSWDDANLDDHQRPLNGRGREAAGRIGRYLRDEGIVPQLVLCSSAARARETLELLLLDPAAEVLVEEALYGASVEEMVSRLRQIDAVVASVLVIGHNPDMEALAQTLTVADELTPAFPTGALAAIRVPIASWAELRPGIATLTSFVTPRELA